MAVDFTVVVNVRQQFGDSDQNIGVFAGQSKNFTFDCPDASSDQAVLLFQSFGVSQQQVLEVNGSTVFGGIPATDIVTGSTSPGGSDFHTHFVLGNLLGSTSNVLLINPGSLREHNNVLRIESSGESFVIDNVVVFYKVRQAGSVIHPS